MNGLVWDSTLWESARLVTVGGRWVIQRQRSHSTNQNCFSEECPFEVESDRFSRTRDFDRFVYLQIATGRWCDIRHATKFPGRGSALSYAEQYGLELDENGE